ncbi:PREDICTED: leucine-rich repeat-containing protein 37A3-like [Lipotes vexillifer]|uniref:Leucine-rich repeat-containing protein 37A3-like n=1 Tax=Lipotes vexillifer TaxID=118797 RepID=A0A340WKN3_LIPVE|nr:PREDICTED: leucine-rich repeat-containing protein 37A3-like [Lipotes vexillifer]
MDTFYLEESIPRDCFGIPGVPPEPPEEAEISPSQQEAQAHHPELNEEAEAQAQHPEPTEEVEPLPFHQEAPSQPSEVPEVLETSSPQEALAQPLETLKEVVVQPVAHHRVNETQQSNLYNVTVKPLDLALTITPQVTKEVACLPGVQRYIHSNLLSVTLQPLNLELTNTPESTTEAEIEPSATLQEQQAQPPEPSSGEVEPTPTQQEQPAQPPEHHEMTVSPPSHPQAQHPNLSSVAVKPADVELTITKEPTPEVGPSPNKHKPSAQPSVPLINAEFSTTQHEVPKLPSQPPEEVEPLSVQQEAPAQPQEAVQQGAPTQPTYPEVTYSNPEKVQAQHPTFTEVTIQPLDLKLTIRPEPTKEEEPSPTIQENLTQPPEPPKEVFLAQPPVYQNPIVPTPDQDHTELPTSPSVTVQPLDMELH